MTPFFRTPVAVTVALLFSVTLALPPVLPPSWNRLKQLNLGPTLRQANSTAPLCAPVAQCIQRLDSGETCDLLPVPPASLIPSPAQGESLITRLRRGVFLFYDGGHQALILYTGQRLAVVDFPEAGGQLLIDAVKERLGGDVPRSIDMVYSHSHFDHIGGAALFYDYVREEFPDVPLSIYGTRETSLVIRDSAMRRAVRPTKLVGPSGRTLKLSDSLELQMTIIGGHTNTDLFLLIPRVEGEAAIGMFVDVVFPGWSPFALLALTNDLGAYLESHDKILEFDYDIFLGGHVLVGTKEDVRRNKQFTLDLIEAAANGVQTVTFEDFLAAGFGRVGDPNAVEFGNIWFAFLGVVRRLQTAACFRTILEKWGCELAGLDITGESHCFLAVQYVLIDA